MAAAIFKATLEETDKRDAARIGYTGSERLKLAFVMAFAGVYLLAKFRSVLGARKSRESRVPVSAWDLIFEFRVSACAFIYSAFLSVHREFCYLNIHYARLLCRGKPLDQRARSREISDRADNVSDRVFPIS